MDSRLSSSCSKIVLCVTWCDDSWCWNRFILNINKCLLHTTCGLLACRSITMSVNLYSWYASCISRQVCCYCRSFVFCCLILFFKNGYKQLNQICSCFELKHCLSYNLKHLSHVNCLCDPLHENTATVLLSYNVKLTYLTPTDCGEAVTGLVDCVMKLFLHLACWLRKLITSIVSGMIWCAVCSYYFSFNERCIRVCVLGKLTVW